VNDRWIRQLHASLKYNIFSLYNFLTSRDQTFNDDHTSIIWYKEVPLKVNIFVWRLLHNRLPTTYNLNRRRVLQPNTSLCLDDCGFEENIDHLFLRCYFFGQIWYHIYSCIGLTSVKPATIHEHILQLRTLGGFSKTVSSTFYLIWLSCTWIVWRDRNSRVFQQKGNSIHQLIDKIKQQFFHWLKATILILLLITTHGVLILFCAWE